MALIKENLKQKIQVFADQLHPLFEGTPSSINENAEKWADAIDTYASLVTPPSTTSSVAKLTFLNIMKGLSEYIIEDPTPLPFTLYYKSPETRMRVFNLYLRNTAQYKPDPSLDRTVVFTKLNKIREEYNRLFPILQLSIDDIKYNQRRFNEIYALEITAGKVIPLKNDGVTTNTTDVRYKDIPVDRTGKIIALQEDGIIGDDTIRYLPLVTNLIVAYAGSTLWDNVYRNIPIVFQPNTEGHVLAAIFPLTNGHYAPSKPLAANYVVRDYINTNQAKDYRTILLDTTQNTIDGGISAQLFPEQQTIKKPISFFIEEFERRHAKFDDFWIKNGIKTIQQLVTFRKLNPQLYKAKPANQKDGVLALENAITAYAQQLAIGMNPTFTGAPSALPLDLSPVAAQGLAGASNADCIKSMVNLIDLYFKGGTATNNSSGSSTTWQ